MAFWISKLRQKRSKKIVDRPSGSGTSKPNVQVRHILLGVLTWLSAVYLLTIGESQQFTDLAPGQKASDTLVAAVDLTCQDVAGTALRLQQAADSVHRIYTLNQGPLDASLRTLNKLTSRLIELRQRSGTKLTSTELEQEVSTILDLLNLPLTPRESLKLLRAGKEKEAANVIAETLQTAWDSGIASALDREGSVVSDEIVIRGIEDSLTKLGVLDTPDAAVQKAIDSTKTIHGKKGALIPALEKLFITWLTPNLIYDAAATDELRMQAQAEVTPQVMEIRAGTTLVERGVLVTDQHLEQVTAHGRRLDALTSPYDRFFTMLGKSSLLLLALVICCGLIRIIQPSIMDKDARLAALFVVSLLTLLLSKGLLMMSLSTRIIPPALVSYMVPMGLAPLLITILMGPGAAVIIGIWTSLATSILFGNSITIFTLGMLVTVLAAHAARDVRRRSTVIKAGLWIGLAKVLCVLSFAALSQQAASTMALQIAAALLSGLIFAILALLLIQLFESLFKITTNISLLELSDMGHPLLQRLAMEAPGTYHHSLMVANLAQAATNEIGGNALLVRICAYFHDIGKLTKPEFFTENTQYRDNPHDDLSPSMSTLVIIAHVKEGVSLARRHKLPQAIIDGIEQHHGTGLISYFYHRAKKQFEAEKEAHKKVKGRTINEEDFRYPGPKPTSKEMGILLLADAVEATSRTMEKPTPNRIESLVRDIVDTRLQDGQLDQCDLTFSQLNTIKRSLIFTLTNMMHGRIPYPKDHEDTDQQQPEHPSFSDREGQTTHNMAHGASTTT